MIARKPFRLAVREFLYGMFGYEFEQEALELRRSAESLFLLAAFGELLGVPVLPPAQALRLLPFLVRRFARWKRSLLRERDWTDLVTLIEGAE